MARLRGKKGLRAGRSKRDREPQRIIGYFAFRGMEAVCDGDACIIAGSAQKMEQLIQRRLGPGKHSFTIRATSFSEIWDGVQMGGTYGFDEEAYGRFLPMAQARGLPLSEQDFSDPGPLGIHLVRVGQEHQPDLIDLVMDEGIWNR